MDSVFQPLPSSYRDNDGFVFRHSGYVYRYIGPSYFEHYDLLMQSGLYAGAVAKGWLVAHTEQEENTVQLFPQLPPGKIILPAQINFISYPYEWSFAMWQDAALVTLKIAKALNTPIDQIFYLEMDDTSSEEKT